MTVWRELEEAVAEVEGLQPRPGLYGLIVNPKARLEGSIRAANVDRNQPIGRRNGLIQRKWTIVEKHINPWKVWCVTRKSMRITSA
jgi:hypothetical protein